MKTKIYAAMQKLTEQLGTNGITDKRLELTIRGLEILHEIINDPKTDWAMITQTRINGD